MRLVIVLLVGCSDVAQSPRDTMLGTLTCDDIAAGGGWQNDFMPQAQHFAFTLYATPIEPDGRPIDAVIGVSDGPAGYFSDLGAIVRFNPQGFVDARNGGGYQATNVFPYRSNTTYRFGLEANTATHTYDAWVWEDSPYPNQVQIAADFAFRSEQASVTRIDSLGRKVDSATGTLRLCWFRPFVYDVAHSSLPNEGWYGQTFPAQTGHFRATIQAESYYPVDAVFGLSRAMPSHFADLAAIARFNPAGYFDVRDGSTYRYDVLEPYVSGQRYLLDFDVDVVAKRYSVTVWRDGYTPSDPVTIATNYAFRTEQQNVSSLGAAGQILDSQDGYSLTDQLRIEY